MYINISNDGNYLLQAEHALPEQYIHCFKNGQLITSPVSHSGG